MSDRNKLSDLIEALQIILKYGDTPWPTNCAHDVLMVNCDVTALSREDASRLATLGFIIDGDGLVSYVFGSS